MTLRAKIEIVAVAVGALLIGWLVFVWVGEREARARAEATQTANANALQVIEQHDAANRTQLDNFLKSQQAQVDALNKRFDQAKTPQDLAPLVQQLMALQKPITFVTPPATPSNPNPQPVAQVPVEDAPQVKAYVSACETCKLNLGTATQKLTYADQQHSDDLNKVKLANDNAAKWEQAAKGGTVLQRVKHDGKLLMIGGAVALAVVCGLGHCPR
jgi:hypothetical protein